MDWRKSMLDSCQTSTRVSTSWVRSKSSKRSGPRPDVVVGGLVDGFGCGGGGSSACLSASSERDALALAAVVREHHRAVFPLGSIFHDDEHHPAFGALSASSFSACVANCSGSAETISHTTPVYFKRYVDWYYFLQECCYTQQGCI
jgi:hypothetical protein